jgi:hypothetical protein
MLRKRLRSVLNGNGEDWAIARLPIVNAFKQVFNPALRGISSVGNSLQIRKLHKGPLILE